jgi:hypothetical protein
LIVSLAGKGKSRYKGADGHFDIQMWKDRVWPRFESVDLDAFIDDGTIAGHYLVDEPHARGRWGGREVPYEALEEIARFSKQHWPGMATFVRAHPTWLAKAPFDWVHLDAGWAQYSSRKGDVAAYAGSESAAATAAGLGFVAGLNVVDGGDGSSRIRSYYDSRKWMMSAGELRTDAAALLTPNACALIFWQWSAENPGYLDRPEIRDAMSDVFRMAREHASGPCGRGRRDRSRLE